MPTPADYFSVLFPGGFRRLLMIALFYNFWEYKQYARRNETDIFL